MVFIVQEKIKDQSHRHIHTNAKSAPSKETKGIDDLVVPLREVGNTQIGDYVLFPRLKGLK